MLCIFQKIKLSDSSVLERQNQLNSSFYIKKVSHNKWTFKTINKVLEIEAKFNLDNEYIEILAQIKEKNGVKVIFWIIAGKQRCYVLEEVISEPLKV